MKNQIIKLDTDTHKLSDLAFERQAAEKINEIIEVLNSGNNKHSWCNERAENPDSGKCCICSGHKCTPLTHNKGDVK